MADPDKSLEILISTKADLAGAKAAEAQLEQDITSAKALGEAYDDLETRLKNVRNATTESQGSDARFREAGLNELPPGGTSPLTPFPSERKGESEAGGNSPLGWVKAGVEALRLAFEAMPKFFGTDKGLIPASAEAQDKVLVEDRAPQLTGQADNTKMAGPALVKAPEERSAQTTARAPGAGAEEENNRTAQIAEGRSQAIQVSGEKIRAALEQNTQITVSLLNRTLELIDQQNRKLGDVDRKIAELNGQIKSLKNL